MVDGNHPGKDGGKEELGGCFLREKTCQAPSCEGDFPLPLSPRRPPGRWVQAPESEPAEGGCSFLGAPACWGKAEGSILPAPGPRQAIHNPAGPQTLAPAALSG